MNLIKATTYEAFFQMEGANDLQFSLTVEVLPSNNSKNGSLSGLYLSSGKNGTVCSS